MLYTSTRKYHAIQFKYNDQPEINLMEINDFLEKLGAEFTTTTQNNGYSTFLTIHFTGGVVGTKDKMDLVVMIGDYLVVDDTREISPIPGGIFEDYFTPVVEEISSYMRGK